MRMFPFTIASVDEVLFEGEVYAAILPGSMGELTIMKDHEPFITTLKAGDVRIRKEKDSKDLQVFAIHGGLLEMVHNKGIVLI